MASRTLSVSNWRITGPRLAPMARRMEISFRRPVARASRRLATLAQAISSTSAADGHEHRAGLRNHRAGTLIEGRLGSR